MDLQLTPKKISIPIIVLILQLFLYISADKIYGAGATTAKALLLAYMLMIVSVSVFTGLRPDKVKGQFNPLNFFIFFIGSALLFLVIPQFNLFATIGVANAVTYGIIQCFVVAYTEESVFRGLLPTFFGDLNSSILFGLFHWAVSGSLWFLVFATGAGLLFAFIRDKFGIYASMGVHSAFNLKALGLLDTLVRGTIK